MEKKHFPLRLPSSSRTRKSISLALLHLRFGNDQRHDDVNDHESNMQTSEESQHEQHTHDGRVDVEVFAQSAAQASEHAVGGTAS